MDNQYIRQLALLLLDDDQGIKEEAYHTLSHMLIISGNEDIMNAVKIDNGRAYVKEDFANLEFLKIEKTEKAREALDGKGTDTQDS